MTSSKAIVSLSSPQALDPTTGEADHVVVVNPSMDSHGTKNPSARVFYLNPENFMPIDYDHFYLDLNDGQYRVVNHVEIKIVVLQMLPK